MDIANMVNFAAITMFRLYANLKNVILFTVLKDILVYVSFIKPTGVVNSDPTASTSTLINELAKRIQWRK